MEVINKKVSELQNWEQNPRTIDEENFKNLKKYIEKHGLLTPLLVDGRDGVTVLGGNMRLRALRELGTDEAPCHVIPIENDKQATEIALLDNNPFGKYDMSQLISLVSQFDLELDDFSIDLKPKKLSDLMPENETKEDGYDVSKGLAKPDKYNIQEGDMFELGNHRVLCGSATELEDVEKLCGGAVMDMVFTDPPYNVNYGATMKDKLRGTDNRKIMNDNLGDNFEQFLSDAIGNMRMVVEGDVYICMSSPELHTLFNAFFKNDGHWSTFLIWVKDHFAIGRSNYQRQYEPILYGWFEKSTHYWSGARNLGDVIMNVDKKEMPDGTYLKVNGIEEGICTDVWEIARPKISKEHPTMKPIELCGRAIRNSSRRGGRVMDLFGGSGSTLIACEQLERSCYMTELDPKFVKVIIDRWELFTGRQATKFNLQELAQ